jgi:methylenetetrahydrofolate dehydrogenase (NADP+)/methenyltetrahydrofolate cyclohydrolase
MPILLDGRQMARDLQASLQKTAAEIQQELGRSAHLAVVQVGNDPASTLYRKAKERLGTRLGLRVTPHLLPADATEAELVALLRRLGADPTVDGILVEQPLPPHLRTPALLQHLDPAKDVDGSTWATQGRLFAGASCFVPATVAGVMHVLEQHVGDLTGKDVAVVGASNVVGKPLALLLLGAQATVTVCHKYTVNLAAQTRQADIVVVAAGVPGLLKADMVRPGAVVIDVGINEVNGETVGDVDFAAVAPVAGAITPVPGGVGALTTTMILQNTLTAAGRKLARANA